MLHIMLLVVGGGGGVSEYDGVRARARRRLSVEVEWCCLVLERDEKISEDKKNTDCRCVLRTGLLITC